MVSSLVSRLVILVFGTLYPAYASYKAVKTKNVKEHVKWMMYWIVFALFTCVETITDVLFSWFPFYYEIKIIIVIWLLSPATRGSSILYRKFVHPTLASKEQEIDDYIAKAKERSYRQVLDLGSKGVNVLMQTAIKGGGGLVSQLRKSYSLSDLTGSPDEDSRTRDETDIVITDPRLIKKRRSPNKASAGASTLYFSEVDVRKNVLLGQVHSTEDISSGYSSGEVFSGQSVRVREGLVRSSSLSSTRPRSVRVTRSQTATKKTSQIIESEEQLIEKRPPNVIPEQDKSSSSSDTEFKDCMEDEISATEINKESQSASSPQKVLPTFYDLDKNSIQQEKQFLQNLPQHTLKRSVSSDSVTVLEHIEKKEKRAGKYNKRAAPPPPNLKKDTKQISGEHVYSEVPTITATLVLQPGIVKPVGPPTSDNSQRSNIFVCHSPKARRKALMKSTSSAKSKLESSFNRLMAMPKRLHFWHKSDTNLRVSPNELKRSSWHENGNFLAAEGLLRNTRMLSKSDNNLQTNTSLSKTVLDTDSD